jgi:hypothetical protein
LLDHGEVSICGLNVNPQLRNMWVIHLLLMNEIDNSRHTQFQRTKETKLTRCKLYLLLNIEKQRIRSAVEFMRDGPSDTKTLALSCVLSDSGEYICPRISTSWPKLSASLSTEVFKPKTLFEQNGHQRQSRKSWQYSFGFMHPNLTFEFDNPHLGFAGTHWNTKHVIILIQVPRLLSLHGRSHKTEEYLKNPRVCVTLFWIYHSSDWLPVCALSNVPIKLQNFAEIKSA